MEAPKRLACETMQEELKVAARWWRVQMQETLKFQLDAFEVALFSNVLSYWKDCRTLEYDPEAPVFCASFRIIENRQNPDPFLRQAMLAAGIIPNALWFPQETAMMINPREILLATGRGQPFKTLCRVPVRDRSSGGTQPSV